MQIYNALDLKSGKKTDYNRMGTLTQPIQFLPEKEKTEEWFAWNLDWFEMVGLRKVAQKAKRLSKNYKLAKGIIDKSDYIVEEDNEYVDIIEKLRDEDNSALELKFYPITPTMVDVLCNEFSKRITNLSIQTVDDDSNNEMLDQKRAEIEKTLLFQAEQNAYMRMIELGLSEEDPQAQQMLSPEAVRSLPEIQQFYNKDYRNLYEIWATHQYKVDVERFRMEEMEEVAFRDLLISDSEFWHFRMLEDDYEVELWNPMQVAYHKSMSTRYISEGSWVTYHDLLTVSDVIDRYGWMMSAQQLQSLEAIFPVKASLYNLPGVQNDGSFYDGTRSHQWNTQMPSLAMRQFQSSYDAARQNGDILEWILSEGEDYGEFGDTTLLRTTTVYWKSQRLLYHLTKITEDGEIIQDIVTENYKVTDKPLYDTTIYKNKSKDNLIFGEHLDPIWINDVCGGIKIGPNRPSYLGAKNSSGFDPIYLGIRGGKPGRVPFQFKGDYSLYGCKLPVEGAVFTDRNGRSVSFVDKTKPFQIGYNMVNNQISDILVDELGTVIVLDQNTLPRHSMGEDWGRNNMAKAFVAMKNFQILPLDTTITNTESAINFQHYQVLDMQQTNRLLGKIQLAEYFKRQAFEAVGLNVTRMGQQLSQQQTATGVEIMQNASYAQTEHYFVQHSDYLMPRVHQMRTELAQFYQSRNPSVRLQYTTSNDERVNFQMNGTKLLTRDFNIFHTTKINHRDLLEKFKSMIFNNNTTGASLYDLANVMRAESLAQMDVAVKALEAKQDAIRQQEMELQQQELQAEMEVRERELMLQQAFEAEQKQKDREKDILVAEIRAAAMSGTQDHNENNQNDYLDALDRIEAGSQFQENMNFKREQELNKTNLTREKLQMEREKLRTQREIAEKQLQIARTNKNKYDSKKSDKKK